MKLRPPRSSRRYGKTAHGLAKDWGVSQPEAQAMLELWYADRPEVRAWQERQHATALETGYTTTLMGRRRRLKSFGGARTPKWLDKFEYPRRCRL